MSDQSCIIITYCWCVSIGKSLIPSTIHEDLCNELGCEKWDCDGRQLLQRPNASFF